MLCPTLIESLFYEVFYTKDGLDFPSAHGHRPVRPTRLGPSGLVLCFYPLQLPPSPHLVRRYLRKGINWGDGQINSCWQFYVHGLTVEIQTWTMTNFGLDDDCKSLVDDVIINKVTVEISSGRWRGSLDDGLGSMRPLGVQSSDKLSRGIYSVRHVLFVDWLESRIEASLRLPCTPSIKTTTLPIISLLFAENTLSERVRHLSEIRPFNSFITKSHPLTLFLGKCFHPFNLFLSQFLFSHW